MKRQTRKHPMVRLWPAFELLPGLACVHAEWKLLLGEELPSIQSFLRPFPQLATSYPRLSGTGYELPYRVVEHGRDDYVGVCDETGDTIPLRRTDLIVYALDRRSFAVQIATALGMEVLHPERDLRTCSIPLGCFKTKAGRQHPALLVFPCDATELSQMVISLISVQRSPFLVLAPTRRLLSSSTDQTLRANGCDLLALNESLTVSTKGEWAARPHALKRMADFGVATQDEPLSDRAQLVLVAMRELGAIDSDSRRSTEKIAQKALGRQSDANALKNVMSELKAREQVHSKTGRGGGEWLSESGLARAAKLSMSLPETPQPFRHHSRTD